MRLRVLRSVEELLGDFLGVSLVVLLLMCTDVSYIVDFSIISV